MKKARTTFALTAIALLVVGSSAAAQEKAVRSGIGQVPVIFDEVAESHKSTIAFDPGEATLIAKHAGMRTTLFGRLEDTSEINLFHAYWYDGRHTAHRRYYVKARVYKRPHTSLWATVDATITQVDTRHDDKHEIRIHSYRGLSTKEIQAIARASVNSHQWVSDNRKMIDLNEFRKGRPKPPLVEEANWRSDFNKLHRRDDVEIRSLDMKRTVVELVCSRYVVEEVPHHHATFIDLIMVYDLKNDAPIRLLVRAAGYFLE
jgi:hypothetical protein